MAFLCVGGLLTNPRSPYRVSPRLLKTDQCYNNVQPDRRFLGQATKPGFARHHLKTLRV